MSGREREQKTPSDLRWAKTKLVLTGFAVMLGAAALAAIDLFTGYPIPARGPFTLFVSIPSVLFGWHILRRGLVTTVADVCDLSELHCGKINVALIVQTFRCTPGEARALLDHMCAEGIFVATKESDETGLRVGYTGIGDDPNVLAEVQREKDNALEEAINGDKRQQEQEFLDALDQEKASADSEDKQVYTLQSDFSHEGTEALSAQRKEGNRQRNRNRV